MLRCGTFALSFSLLFCSGSSFVFIDQNVDPDPETDTEIPEYDTHPKISGGVAVNQNDPIPYQLRIEYVNPQNGHGQHICGAVLLDEKTAITAAHCFDDVGDWTRLVVVAGDYRLNEHEITEQVKEIKKVIIHPKYTDFRHGNDMAVLHVDKLRLSNKYTRGVWLSTISTEKLSNLSAVISGWGIVSDGAPASNSLQKGNVRILPPEDCLDRLTNRMKVAVREGIVCAQNPLTRTCSGDSGGPLVIQNYKEGNSTGNLLVGITSFGPLNCSRQNSAGAFTEISHFYDWIQANRDPPLISSCSVAMEACLSPRSKKQTIYPHGNTNKVEVLCDFESDGGGWTIIQKRSSGPKREFQQNWNEYEKGFGSLDGNFWIGLENIYALTKNGDQELRIELEDFEGNKKYAKYSNFSVSDASDFYRLTVSGFFPNSTAGDSMTNPNSGTHHLHNRRRFSTKDKDNGGISVFDCATEEGGGGGWWFNYCGLSRLNGIYFEKEETVPHGGGIFWFSWKGWKYSLAKTEMKIRKKK